MQQDFSFLYQFKGEKMKMLFLIKVALLLSLVNVCVGGRRLTSLVKPTPLVLTYHKGALLEGSLPINIVWYGEFAAVKRSIVVDFLASLNQKGQEKDPSVFSWWKLTEGYLVKAGKPSTVAKIVLGKQFFDEKYSLGKSLKREQIGELAAKAATHNGITLVLTSKDVAAEGFCMSSCGLHDSVSLPSSKRVAYIWVGNSETQCPGQCAWPFHQPLYGPQSPPLVAPNGDVGVDGMIINIASLLAGTVTNPFGNGYFQGPATAPLEVASACPGIYGKNAYPGYAGELLVDASTGASYNANGINSRQYLLPALWNPKTSTCSTLV